nr:HNH endonuclease [Herelleviridae sp.]
MKQDINVEEVWKDIQGGYQVSNLGNVRGPRKVRRLCNRNGYLCVCLSINGAHNVINVHRLVAEAFIPNVNNLPCVNHKDEDKTNNSVDNLEWCTVEYNNNYGKQQLLKKPVLQFDKRDCLIQEFESVRSAERLVGVPRSNIISCCKLKVKTAGGYIWKYK